MKGRGNKAAKGMEIYSAGPVDRVICNKSDKMGQVNHGVRGLGNYRIHCKKKVSNIPAGDGKIANPFIQSILNEFKTV